MGVMKRVRCVETGEVFESVTAAAISIGQLYQADSKRAPAHVSHVINGHREKAGGFHWEMIDGPISVEELVDGFSTRGKATFKEEPLPKIYKEIKRQPPKQEKVNYPPEGYIYIFRNRWHPEGTYKIGSTDNLQDRRSAARTWGPYDCEFYLQVTDCKLVESMVHEMIRDYRVEGFDIGQEHFSIDLEKATSIIKNVAFELACMHKDCAA